jgi:hypothetical protein
MATNWTWPGGRRGAISSEVVPGGATSGGRCAFGGQSERDDEELSLRSLEWRMSWDSTLVVFVF